MTTDYFGMWNATKEEFNEVLTRNPSIRGMVHGYLAEEKLKAEYFEPSVDITNLHSPDDHDRELKADWIFEYEGEEILCEVKSLQSNSVKNFQTSNGDVEWSGKFQCDASDRREVALPNGETLETTCLVVGEFDILAINLFAFGQEWRWAFARNEDLPRTPYTGYTKDVRQHLIKGTMGITWPLQEDGPYYDNPWDVLALEVERR